MTMSAKTCQEVPGSSLRRTVPADQERGRSQLSSTRIQSARARACGARCRPKNRKSQNDFGIQPARPRGAATSGAVTAAGAGCARRYRNALHLTRQAVPQVGDCSRWAFLAARSEAHRGHRITRISHMTAATSTLGIKRAHLHVRGALVVARGQLVTHALDGAGAVNEAPTRRRRRWSRRG